MAETLALVSSVSLLLMLDALITRVGSQRTARATTRSFAHARPVTRSRYMAHKEVYS